MSAEMYPETAQLLLRMLDGSIPVNEAEVRLRADLRKRLEEVAAEPRQQDAQPDGWSEYEVLLALAMHGIPGTRTEARRKLTAHVRSMVAQAGERECRWMPELDGYYSTDCGEAFVIEAGTPDENKMRFCCYCGGRLRASLTPSAPRPDSEENRDGA